MPRMRREAVEHAARAYACAHASLAKAARSMAWRPASAAEIRAGAAADRLRNTREVYQGVFACREAV